MIAFRKAHPVFHLPVEPKNIDYLVCGHPDVSYHGVKTWCPEFDAVVGNIREMCIRDRPCFVPDTCNLSFT